MDADGVTLGESHEDRAEMENHLLRPEVQQALKAGQGSSTRYSTTLGYEMMYGGPDPEGDGCSVMRGILLQEIEAHSTAASRHRCCTGRYRRTCVFVVLAPPAAATLTDGRAYGEWRPQRHDSSRLL
jgi:hypothetical protein